VLGIAIDEKTTRDDVAALLKLISRRGGRRRALDARVAPADPSAGLLRSDAILTHPVFNTHHTEHEMLRYLKRCRTRIWRSTTR
jgi:glycine dehydrogenase